MEDCTLEEQLLLHAKEGNCPQVQRLLQSRIHQNSSLNINCRCKLVCGGGCHHPTALMSHVTRKLLILFYFFLLFLSLAVARSKTCSGWTPLHLACSFGRRDVVEQLLKVRAVYESHHYHAFCVQDLQPETFLYSPNKECICRQGLM